MVITKIIKDGNSILLTDASDVIQKILPCYNSYAHPREEDSTTIYLNLSPSVRGVCADDIPIDVSKITIPDGPWTRQNLLTELKDNFLNCTLEVNAEINTPNILAKEAKQDTQIVNQGTAGATPPAIPGTGIIGYLRSIFDRLINITLFTFTTGWLNVKVTNPIDCPIPISGKGSEIEDSLFAHLTDGTLAQGSPGFSGFNTLKTSQETQIFEEGWSTGLDLVEKWNDNSVGDGSVTVLDSEGLFSVESDADVSEIQTKLPHIFFHGFSTLWRIAYYTPDAGTDAQPHEFGPFDSQDGYFWRIKSNGLNCVIRRKGSETTENIPGYTAGRHGYAIQYLDGNQVRFYVDGVLVHSAISGANNLIAKSNLPTTIRRTQTGAAAVNIGKAYGLAVIREGAPFAFTSSGELIVTSGLVSTPPGATKVLRPDGDPFIELGPNDVVDDFYTITNGSTLTIQQLRARVESAGTGKSVRVELFSDPDGDDPAGPSDNQPASWIRIDTLMGNNFNEDAAQDLLLTGDGTARVVLRLHQIGSATVSVVGIWQGFET